MRPPRRWLQYSLRSFLVAMTAFAVWLGIVVHRAREQREAVMAIEALGGKIEYDRLTGPDWLRRMIGDEYLLNVWAVDFTGWASEGMPRMAEANVKKAIPHLKRLRRLEAIAFLATVSPATTKELQAILPGSEVSNFIGDSKVVYTEHAARRLLAPPRDRSTTWRVCESFVSRPAGSASGGLRLGSYALPTPDCGR